MIVTLRELEIKEDIIADKLKECYRLSDEAIKHYMMRH